jgi:hypothetical protein
VNLASIPISAIFIEAVRVVIYKTETLLVTLDGQVQLSSSLMKSSSAIDPIMLVGVFLLKHTAYVLGFIEAPSLDHIGHAIRELLKLMKFKVEIAIWIAAPHHSTNVLHES